MVDDQLFGDALRDVNLGRQAVRAHIRGVRGDRRPTHAAQDHGLCRRLRAQEGRRIVLLNLNAHLSRPHQ